MSDVELRDYIRDIPDFPQPGILFRDITPLLASPVAFGAAIDRFAERFQDAEIQAIAAAEARGFIFAAPLALRLNAAFVPIRKPGKLPFETHAFRYELEYGDDTLEIHTDGITAGQRVLVIDDLLATGGTVDACCNLLEQNGADIVACAFLIELKALNGAARISSRPVFSLLEYE